MKRSIIKYFAILSAVLLVSSCEWNPPTFNSDDSFIAFTASSSGVAETGSMIGIPVLVTAESSAPAVSVTFDFDETSAAVEGEHFNLVNASNTLDINGWGYDTIWIEPIDNDIFTGNLALIINLTSNTKSYPFGVTSSHTLTIIDDEHPLGTWIGTYSVDAADINAYPGSEVWAVSTAPDPSDVNNLLVTGIGGFVDQTAITGVVDLDAKTITFSAGSEVGTHADYGGPLAVFLGDADRNMYEEPIVGEVRDDGTIYVDMLGIMFVAGVNEGFAWGVWETTWNPAKKKAAQVNPEPVVMREIKLQR